MLSMMIGIACSMVGLLLASWCLVAIFRLLEITQRISIGRKSIDESKR